MKNEDPTREIEAKSNVFFFYLFIILFNISHTNASHTYVMYNVAAFVRGRGGEASWKERSGAAAEREEDARSRSPAAQHRVH